MKLKAITLFYSPHFHDLAIRVPHLIQRTNQRQMCNIKSSLSLHSWSWPHCAAFTAHTAPTINVRASHICCVPDCVALMHTVMQWLMTGQNKVFLYGLISNWFPEPGPAAAALWVRLVRIDLSAVPINQ